MKEQSEVKPKVEPKPNSAETMTQAEIEAHYTLENFPPIKYYSSGGGGQGSLTPPKSKR